MKLLLLAAMFVAPAFAQAEFDACDHVFMACASKGFKKDDLAPQGKKIWLDCADVLVNQGKPVATVNLDPKSPHVKYCRDYRNAKAQFDSDWEKKNKRPTN